jgi:hypothetical protein
VVKAKLTDEEFAREMQIHGSVGNVARAHGMDPRGLHRRRHKMAERGVVLTTKLTGRPEDHNIPPGFRGEDAWTWPRQKDLWLHEGTAVVFSDAHYWPGEPSLAHRALLQVIKAVKPRAVFANGDIFDGAGLSRFPPFGFSKQPSPVDELHACQERMGEIEQAVPRGCELIWNVGNHDSRWERVLAQQADKFAGLHGLRLADHFPPWEMVWSTMINGSARGPVMVKHRYNGGIHSAYNNTLRAGMSIVTGHTHALEVKPWGDYRGRRWGVQTGSLADLHGPQFEYHENSPSPMCSGFAVLTFHDGEMRPPELCEVIDGKAWFRGEIVAREEIHA